MNIHISTLFPIQLLLLVERPRFRDTKRGRKKWRIGCEMARVGMWCDCRRVDSYSQPLCVSYGNI